MNGRCPFALALRGFENYRRHPQRLRHLARRSGLGGGQSEGDFAQDGGGCNRFPERLPIGQATILVGADEPLGAGLGTLLGFRKQFVYIALSVGDIDQARLGELGLRFAHPLIAFEPADAFLLFNRPLTPVGAKVFWVASPVPGVKDTQGHPLGRDH